MQAELSVRQPQQRPSLTTASERMSTTRVCWANTGHASSQRCRCLRWHVNDSDRDWSGPADSFLATTAMPQRLRACTAGPGAEQAAREGIAANAAHAPAAAGTANAVALGDAAAHSRQMDAWEAHLAASDVTLCYIERLMDPDMYPEMLMLTRWLHAERMAGMRRQHRGLLLPLSITQVPAAKLVATDVWTRRPRARSGALQVRCGTRPIISVQSTAHLVADLMVQLCLRPHSMEHRIAFSETLCNSDAAQ